MIWIDSVTLQEANQLKETGNKARTPSNEDFDESIKNLLSRTKNRAKKNYYLDHYIYLHIFPCLLLCYLMLNTPVYCILDKPIQAVSPPLVCDGNGYFHWVRQCACNHTAHPLQTYIHNSYPSVGSLRTVTSFKTVLALISLKYNS